MMRKVPEEEEKKKKKRNSYVLRACQSRQEEVAEGVHPYLVGEAGEGVRPCLGEGEEAAGLPFPEAEEGEGGHQTVGVGVGVFLLRRYPRQEIPLEASSR